MYLAPRPLGQVLGEGVSALARLWRPLALTALIVFIPVGLLTIWVFDFTGAADFLELALNDPARLEGLTREGFLERARPFLTAAAVASAAQGLGTVFLYLAAARAVTLDAAGEAVTGKLVRRHALRRYAPAVLASIIVLAAVGALIGVGVALWMIPLTSVGTPNTTSALIAPVLLVALAGPGAWLAVSLSMFPAALSAEEIGPFASLRRSFNLVRGRWWPTLGFLLLVGLLGFAAVQLIQLTAIPLTAAPGADGWLSPAAIFGLAAQGLISAANVSLCSAWYVDLRARQEALTPEDLI